MKQACRFKVVTVDGFYVPIPVVRRVCPADTRGVAFYREGVRRWDGPAVLRAARKADRRRGRASAAAGLAEARDA